MVAGVFVYPHLFSTQKTNVSDLLTSDSPTIFLNRLVSVLLAVATLPLWEELFRHTDLSPSREEIELNGGQSRKAYADFHDIHELFRPYLNNGLNHPELK
jgi:hypothetical protein